MLTEKIIKRYYRNGKGYATKLAAYKPMAKQELGKAALEWVIEKYGNNSADIEKPHYGFFIEKFPLHPCGTFTYGHSGLHCEENHSDYQRHDRAFCNGCRHDWINKRARELMEEYEKANL